MNFSSSFSYVLGTRFRGITSTIEVYEQYTDLVMGFEFFRDR